MPKKKIKWLAPLTASAFAAMLGITAISTQKTQIYAQENDGIELMSYSPTETLNRTNGYEVEAWVRTAMIGDSKEIDGIKYTLNDGDILTIENVADLGSVETIILPSSVKRTNTRYYTVDAQGFNISYYVNLKRVILQGNSAVEKYAAELAKCENAIDVYTTGNIAGLEKVTNLKDLYICETFDSNSVTSSNLKKIANASKCEHIYFAYWTYDWLTLNGTLKNVNSQNVVKSFVTEDDLHYTKDFFLPYTSFKANGMSESYVIEKQYASFNSTEDLVSSAPYKYNVGKVYNGVEKLVLSYKGYIDSNIQNCPKKIVARNLDQFDSTFLMNTKSITDIFLTDSTLTSLNVSNIKNVLNILLTPSSTPAEIATITASTTINANLNLYIPNEYKDKYSKIINDETLKNNIHYFDLSAVNTTKNEVVFDDGKIFMISSKCTTLPSNLQTSYTEYKTKGYNFDETLDVDTQITIFKELDENGEGPSLDVITGETAGYKALGLIYYSSDKSKEDILKIAGSYILQQNGQRYQDINKYEVKFTLDDENLTITVKVDGTLVSDITGKLTKLDSTEYGEFIYMQSLTSSYGELLIDSDSNTNKNVNEIYSYALGKAQEVTSITPTTNTDFKISTPSAADLETTYVQNGNTYKAKAEALSFNLDEVIGTNPNITISNTNQEESDYKVKEITKIYVPASILAHGVPSAINNSIIEYQNKRYEGTPLIHMVSSTNKHNGENYELAIFGKLPDSTTYRQDIPVEIIENSYNLAFVLCSDGTIIVIAPFTRKLDVAKVKSDTTSFITNVLKNTNEITFADFNTEETKSFYGSTVGENSLDIVVSGLSSLEESNPTTPVDLSALKQGYTALNKFVFTSDYSIEDAAKLLAEKSLYYNGLPATTKYNLKVTTSSKWISIEYLNEQNEKILSLQTSYTIVKNSKYSFVSAMSDYYTGIIVTDKQNLEVSTFMNEIMKNVISLEEYDFQSTVNMESSGTTNLTGTMHHINQNYYSYDLTIIVEDTKQAIKDSKLEITKSSLKDEVNNAFDDFKEKFQNNKAFKYSMMALGTILGILLIYGAYLLIRKFIKWLKH